MIDLTITHSMCSELVVFGCTRLRCKWICEYLNTNFKAPLDKQFKAAGESLKLTLPPICINPFFMFHLKRHLQHNF